MATDKNTTADAINDPPPGKAPSAATIADVGTPNPPSMRTLAEDLPDNDPVQAAYKDAMLADSAQAEAKAKAKVVDESPNAAETPSGAALKAVTGVSNDAERGEKYLREKTARRWGYVPVD
jgi:hypothetical protein